MQCFPNWINIPKIFNSPHHSFDAISQNTYYYKLMSFLMLKILKIYLLLRQKNKVHRNILNQESKRSALQKLRILKKKIEGDINKWKHTPCS